MSKVPFITIVTEMYAFGFQMEEGYVEYYVTEVLQTVNAMVVAKDVWELPVAVDD